MFIRKNRLLLCILLIALSISSLAYVDNTVAAEENTESQTKTIRVAFPTHEGMSYFDNNGNPSGYNYGYLEKISEFTGWDMEYVAYDNADENEALTHALDDLQNGKVDILGPILKNEQTEAMFDFPENSYGMVYTTLCALDTSNIREERASAVKNLKIGLLQNADIRNAEVQTFLQGENLEAQFMYYSNLEEQVKALESGEVDLISSVSLSPIEKTRIIEKFSPRPYYFAVTKGNTQLAAEIDHVIETINEVQPSLSEVLFENYFYQTRYQFALTDEQKQYLKEIGELQVLCIDHDAPYVYQRDDKPAGMLVLVLNDFAEKTGIKINYTFCENSDEAVIMVKQNRYDMMIGHPFTSDYCARAGFIRSKSIMDSQLAYLYKTDDSKKKVIAVESGLEDYVDLDDSEEIIVLDSAEECNEAVENGRADAALGDATGLEYYIYNRYNSLHTSQLTGAKQKICIAINRDSDAEFIRIVNDYIYSLSDTQKTSLLEEGNRYVHNTSLIYYVRSHIVQSLVICSVLAALLGLAGAGIFHAKQMRKKNEELEKTNLAKSEFLTRMSHDIRTPMNGIIGMLDISDRFVNDPVAVREYHRKIRSASEYLLELINDVLDMSRLESKEVILTEKSLYLKEVVTNCRDILESRASEASVEIIINRLDEFNPPRVLASEMHIRQITMNLVSNAIKYNKTNGKVYITPIVVKSDADTVTCELKIQDTGIGMSEEFQKTMFEPFTQENSDHHGEFKGTGLGLSIVKRVIDAMGGSIKVESMSNEGSTFTWTQTFRLDKDYKEPENIIEPDKFDLKGKKILVAEDNSINAEIISFMLTEQGADIDLVADGQQAVDRFSQSNVGEYDFILMDVMMPVMDGYEACKRIRAMQREDSHAIPIIALTANAFAEDEEKSKHAGMDAHITKPIDMKKLQVCMRNLSLR